MTVQYSTQKMVSDGTLSTIALGIRYLQRNDIYMRIAGEETPQSGAPSGYTWSFINNTTIKILPVVPNGVEVVVYRRTDVDAMYNIYSQNAQFDGATIDENNQQLLYIAQEYLEQGLPGTGIESLEYINTIAGINYYHFKLTDGSYTPVFGVPDGTVTLRAELSAPSGSGTIGFEQAGSGSVARTSQNKMRERITPQDKGAVGDGVTNDQAAFDALEASFSGQVVDLMSKTYLVTSIPTGSRYANGYFKVGSSTFKAVFDTAPKFGSGRVASGEGALASLPDDYDIGEEGLLVAIGAGAMGAMTQAKKAIAIGPGSQSEGTMTRDNISIGEDSQRFVQALTPDYDQDQQQGTRNNSVGGNSLRFLRHGKNCNAYGRNAGQCIVDGVEFSIFGANAVGGYAPVGLTGGIENWTPNSALDGATAFGSQSQSRVIGGYNTSGGWRSLQNLVQGRGNAVWGQDAMRYAEDNLGFNGGIKTDKYLNGTYTQAETTLTLTIAAHGVLVGEIVGIRLLDGAAQTFQNDIAPAYVASVPNANTIVITSPRSFTTSGNAILYWALSSPSALKSERNTVVGAQAAREMRIGSNNAIGGYQAMSDARSEVAGEVDDNVALGSRALTGWTKPKKMTAIGTDALRFMQNGSVATGAGLNCTGLGHSSRVSGDNQVQLGDAATTTYVFGTVQNRSDINDKTGVRDTVLGIDFIMGLRPVDGRWDLRDDYIEEYQVQVGIDDNAQPVFESRVRQLPKDGSKARTRLHHWFIAQEVKELCDKLGVDFGGYQDHSVNGGCDVLTLGYDEFIPPTVKAVQQCWTRLNAIEARIAKLEA